MESDGFVGCLVIIAAILIKGFFTACETAFADVNDSKTRSYENETGNKKTLYKLLVKPSRLITVFTVNRIFTAVIISYLSLYCFLFPLTNKLADLFGSDWDWSHFPVSYSEVFIILLAVIIIMLVAVLVMTVFSDGMPKRLINNKNCESFAVACAPAVKLLVIILTPFTALSSLIVNLLSKLFGLSHSGGRDVVTEEEILMMVDAGNETGVIEESAREMINNVFEFDDLPVCDVMTHRTDITAVECGASVSEIVNASISTGFSRIPVYEENIDHIIGIICVKDLLCFIGAEMSAEASAKSFIRDLIYLPETVSCREAFKRLTAKKLQLAVIIDEYGGTEGIVTMEDIVEAIVGNIQDEYDDEEEELIRLSDDTYIIDGTAEPGYILKQLGIILPEDNDFETMSGFIVEQLGRIPSPDENPSVSCGNVLFTVLITEDMCITKIKAKISAENEINIKKETFENEEEN